VSEISITRFQPALAAREKVKSVQASENQTSLENAQNPLEDPQQEKKKDDSRSSRPVPARSRGKTSDKTRVYESAEHDAVAPVGDESMEQVVSRLNDYVQSVKRDIIFDFDPDSGEPSVTVVDRESRKILRQIDSKEALELARSLEKQEPISLFKTQV